MPNKDGKPTEELVYSTYNLKQLNEKTNRVYLINEQTKAIDAQTPVSDSEKDNNCEFLQTPDGTNCSYIIDMFSIQALYKGNFEIIFYADNPYTNNEEYYLRLSVWSFRGKTKSTLNNYLRYMTTNYKTSFLLPHDYEIPTFNYPQYVLPPVPYNYPEYTKDIWDGKTGQALITKITALAQCKKAINSQSYVNLFDDGTEYNGYYETEINLRQIDPTIQSIDKFISSYKTIEISNLDNLQVNTETNRIESYIKDRNIGLNSGGSTCDYDFGSLSNITLQKTGLKQTDKVNFDNTITLYTNNIRVNDIQTFATASTSGLPSEDYPNKYITQKGHGNIKFLLQITKLSDNVNDKIKETYLQAYYTNDMKLKIRFSKVLLPQLFLGINNSSFHHFGNDKDITIDLNALGVLNMVNNNDSPVKITFKPR
ncbi:MULTISPECIES: hypothetical protein [unclassified Spiroplasma]|uniref:hypothetical protein n=1 Tax=unclassified Spiroplasma TaxID=2637901 RepID=UPI0030CC13DF